MPDWRAIEVYYGKARNRPNLALDCDSGVRWQGLALILRVQLLADRSRPFLTYKVICRDPAAPGETLLVKDIPQHDVLSKALCDLREGITSSKWSLATGDMLLPGKVSLNVTAFTGEALELVEATGRQRVIQAIVDELLQLRNEMAEKVENLQQPVLS